MPDPTPTRTALVQALKDAAALDGIHVYSGPGGTLTPPAIWVAHAQDWLQRQAGSATAVGLEVVVVAARGDDVKALDKLEATTGAVLGVLQATPGYAWRRVDGAIPVTVSGVTYLATSIDVTADIP